MSRSDTWSQSLAYQFMQSLNTEHQLTLNSYTDLHRFSTSDPSTFWTSVLTHSKIPYSGELSPAIENEETMSETHWFPNLSLNYAEYCLTQDNQDSLAITYTKTLDNCPSTLTYKDLQNSVSQVASLFKSHGIKSGDCIAAIMGNHPLAIISLLACASIGATWTCCAPNFGADAISSRLTQAKPKLLIADSTFSERGQTTDISSSIDIIQQSLPGTTVIYSNTLSFDPQKESSLHYERVPFNSPLWVLYSSGTTGAPKAIIHRVGGMILKHEVEHRFHANLTADDTLFYYTSTGWMMWNWMVSGLAQGAHIICHDDAPTYSKFPLWHLVHSLDVSIFGCSAAYLQYTHDRLFGKESFHVNTDRLHSLLYTGSALSPDTAASFLNDYSLRPLGICGGTDLCGCFFGPTPGVFLDSAAMGPILGMDVDAINEDQESVYDESGDLICKQSFPAQPIGLLNDTPSRDQFKTTYFEHPDHGPVNYWFHGDYVIQSVHALGPQQFQVLGRSDATLNAGGVRIGTAELYNALEPLSFIEDSLVTTIPRNKCDETIILFIKLTAETEYTLHHKKQIQECIKAQNPYAIPKDIHVVSDIPYTLSGKKVEKSVKKLLRGEVVSNKDALRNPECLREYEAFAMTAV